jgi:hypothetical protein
MLQGASHEGYREECGIGRFSCCWLLAAALALVFAVLVALIVWLIAWLIRR